MQHTPELKVAFPKALLKLCCNTSTFRSNNIVSIRYICTLSDSDLGSHEQPIVGLDANLDDKTSKLSNLLLLPHRHVP